MKDIMQIRIIDTDNRKDRSKFIRFPFSLYMGNEYWVPPLISDMELVLDRKRHPFFLHSEADFLVAEDNHKILGRMAIIHNRNYCAAHQEQTAFFYHLDFMDDPEVVDALFNTAINWARERGLKKLMGPRGMVRSSGIGMLREGFNYLPPVGQNYNYPYYNSHLERLGFEKETDHYTSLITRETHLPSRMFEAAERIKQRGEFWVKTFTNRREMLAMIPEVDRVHHEAFQNNPGFYPSTPEEFDLIARSMIAIADPKYIKLIMRGDEIAGFILTYANISRGLQRARGRLFPLGWYYILRDKASSPIIDGNGVGLLPKYQGMGANILLYTELDKTLRSQEHLQQMYLVQVDERNFKSQSDVETIGGNRCICHRTYRLSI